MKMLKKIVSVVVVSSLFGWTSSFGSSLQNMRLISSVVSTNKMVAPPVTTSSGFLGFLIIDSIVTAIIVGMDKAKKDKNKK